MNRVHLPPPPPPITNTTTNPYHLPSPCSTTKEKENEVHLSVYYFCTGHLAQICFLGLQSINTSLPFPAGRAIRHREDYAVIVLADQRYARPSVTSKLPAWISRQLTTLDKFPPALAAISKVSVVRGRLALGRFHLTFKSSCMSQHRQ